MKTLKNLFASNRAWAEAVKAADPSFFQRLTQQQAPKYLWIGCSDSRVPANQIVGLMPGELFVHRNVGNLVIHTDLNCLSVLQYAIDVLKVEHIIVCGHYGCGAVRSAMSNAQHGLIDNWLRNIKDVYHRHHDEINRLPARDEQVDRLCELNVLTQVSHVCHTGLVQNGWKRGQPLSIHGWIYSIGDGLLRDLDLCITSEEDIERVYRLEDAGL